MQLAIPAWIRYGGQKDEAECSKIALPTDILALQTKDLRDRFLKLPNVVKLGPDVTWHDKYDLKHQCQEAANVLNRLMEALMHEEKSVGLNVPLSPLIKDASQRYIKLLGSTFNTKREMEELVYVVFIEVWGPLHDFCKENHIVTDRYGTKAAFKS